MGSNDGARAGERGVGENYSLLKFVSTVAMMATVESLAKTFLYFHLTAGGDTRFRFS